MYLDIYLRSRPQDGTLVYKAFSFLFLKIIHSFRAAGSGIRIFCRFRSIVLDANFSPTLGLPVEKGKTSFIDASCEFLWENDVYQCGGLDISMAHSLDFRTPLSLGGSSWQPWHSHYKASD